MVLAGNPNVGKSTLFNALTGMSQHTGNWAGKTVDIAVGESRHAGRRYLFCDLPGTYSLLPRSREETVARDFICFGGAEVTVVVADATRLRASISLILSALEVSGRCVLCLNFVKEARRRGAVIDEAMLCETLGTEVVSVDARGGEGIDRLFAAIDRAAARDATGGRIIPYPDAVERAISYAEERLGEVIDGMSRRFVALRLIENDREFSKGLAKLTGMGELIEDISREVISIIGESDENRRDMIGRAEREDGERFFAKHPELCLEEYSARDEKIDRVVTGRIAAIPTMMLLLILVLWITVSLANYPSAWLSYAFDTVIGGVGSFLSVLGAPVWLSGVICDGILGTLASVISVMLVPMAIFFPLFSLLEDSGYLPRIAYNLDRPLACSGACGKQALTMCMGLGCNAVGVMGCRIIDSPRERLAAVLTNSLMPCNGRFPTVIFLSGSFFAVGLGGLLGGFVTALVLAGVVVLGVILTMILTRVLTFTLLRGESSFFTVEMPPYRRPDFLRVLTRALLDRTLSVLKRAVAVAAPAGLVIWILANVTVSGDSLLSYVVNFIDPIGRFLGMDGTILAAFVLGLPANEIVLPIALMTYAAEGSMCELSASAMREILVANGWDVWTAASVILFSLCHFPCATTLLTIKRETGKLRYTVLAFILPTLLGVLLCATLNFVSLFFT